MKGDDWWLIMLHLKIMFKIIFLTDGYRLNYVLNAHKSNKNKIYKDTSQTLMMVNIVSSNNKIQNNNIRTNTMT